MSTDTANFGQRMREVRLACGYSQAKAAVRLEIADRTYKFYELGKREMPISTALKFCNEFDVELKWLAMGEGPKMKLQQENLVEAVALAVLQMHREKDLNPPAEKVAKQISFVLDQCTAKGTSPIDEARLLIEVL